jgi:S-DNA-T family DNA segregation ATPase FtsK/SpoIIIE
VTEFPDKVRHLRPVDEPDDEPAPADEPGRDLAVPTETAPAVRETAEVTWWHQTPQGRPILAPWLVVREDRRAATRWLTVYTRQASAFHAVRIPLYTARLIRYTPRGAGRAIWLWWQWVCDTEGHAIRLNARDKNHEDVYLKLAKLRDERVKARWSITGIVAGGSAIALTVCWLIWPVTPYLLTAAAVGVLGYVGRRLDRPFFPPAVLTSPEAPRLTGEIVVRALGSLGIPAIDRAVKSGPPITFASECHRDGAGWRAEVDLPYGVTAFDIMEKRRELASGLRRKIGCVWPEPDPDAHAGRLVLFVGDQDLASARQKPWPLLRSGKADTFEPIPFGYNQRGRLISIRLMFENVLIGAIPRQGKTFTLRVLALGIALDPIAEARVFELKGTGDLSCMEKVATHYGSGPDDDTIYQCLLSLRGLHKDLERRAKVIRGLPKDVCPENKVTPELARKKSLGLHPVAFILDEAQELFSHPEYGKEAAEKAIAIIKRGPALAVFMLLATQRPDKDSLPTGISANVSIRLCLRVMGHTENDMILGTSAHKNGIKATMFTQRDKGVMYAVGVEDDPLIVRSSYIDNPMADQVAERARVLRKQAGTLAGYAAGEEQEVGPTVSLVEDVADILQDGEDRLWCQTAVERLAELRPAMYSGWTAGQLTDALKPYGVRTGDTWGKDADGVGRNRKGFEAKAVIEAVSKIMAGAR